MVSCTLHWYLRPAYIPFITIHLIYIVLLSTHFMRGCKRPAEFISWPLYLLRIVWRLESRVLIYTGLIIHGRGCLVAVRKLSTVASPPEVKEYS